VITQLTRNRSLYVVTDDVSRHGESDARRIGQRLGIRYLLEGSVRRAAGRAWINARLIDLASGKYLWANRYDRVVVDAHLVQDEIANAVAAAVDVVVTSADQQQVLHKPWDNLLGSIRARSLALRPVWHGRE
jgi:adenylate cyclase